MEDWKEWMVLLEESLKHRQEKEKSWRRWRSWYRHAGPTPWNPDNPNDLRVHLIRPLLQILLPALYFRNPHIIVNPLSRDDDDSVLHAAYQEAWINYFWSSGMDSKRQVRKAVLDALIHNVGYVESKWQYETQTTGEKGSIDHEEYITNDRPFMLRVSPWDVTYDIFSLNGLGGARWVGRRKWVPTEHVRMNKGFNQKVRNSITRPDMVFPDRKLFRQRMGEIFSLLKLKDREGRGTETTLDEEYEGLSQLWYIYDLQHQRHMVITPHAEGFLVDTDNPYSHLRAFAMRELTFEFDNDMDMPYSLVEDIIPQARELNDIRKRQSEYIKRFARIFFYEPDQFVDGKVALRRMRDAKDGTGVPVYDVQRIPTEMKHNPMEMDWWRWVEAVKGDAFFVRGIPPTQTGTGHQKFKSATEVQEIASAFDIRTDDLRETVAEWVEGIAEITGANIQQFLDDRKKFEIIGESGEAAEQEIGGEDVAGYEYAYQVLMSETMPESEQKRLERWRSIYTIAMQDPLVNRRKILEQLFRAAGVPNTRSYFVDAQMQGNEQPYGGKEPSAETGQAGMAPENILPLIQGGMLE